MIAYGCLNSLPLNIEIFQQPYRDFQCNNKSSSKQSCHNNNNNIDNNNYDYNNNIDNNNYNYNNNHNIIMSPCF